MQVSYHNRDLIATSNYASMPTESAAGLVFAKKERRIYARGAAPRRHLCYDRLISELEGRQVIDAATGVPLTYILLPAVKEALAKEGRSALENSQAEDDIIDSAEFLRPWIVQRAVPRELYNELKKEGRTNVIFNNRIVSVPGPLLNGLVCNNLLEIFSVSELLSIPGFILRQTEFDNGRVESVVRIDLESYLARRGFIVPVIKSGFIHALRVYKHPNDERPFILKSRGGEVALNA